MAEAALPVMLLPEEAVERLTATVGRITVLPGAQEARLTYLAARRWTAFSARRLLVVDIGGGSLEIAAGERDRPDIGPWASLLAAALAGLFATLWFAVPLAHRVSHQHQPTQPDPDPPVTG